MVIDSVRRTYDEEYDQEYCITWFDKSGYRYVRTTHERFEDDDDFDMHADDYMVLMRRPRMDDYDEPPQSIKIPDVNDRDIKNDDMPFLYNWDRQKTMTEMQKLIAKNKEGSKEYSDVLYTRMCAMRNGGNLSIDDIVQTIKNLPAQPYVIKMKCIGCEEALFRPYEKPVIENELLSIGTWKYPADLIETVTVRIRFDNGSKEEYSYRVAQHYIRKQLNEHAQRLLYKLGL